MAGIRRQVASAGATQSTAASTTATGDRTDSPDTHEAITSTVSREAFISSTPAKRSPRSPYLAALVFVGLIVVAGLIVAVGATVRDDSTNPRLTEQTVRPAPTPVRVAPRQPRQPTRRRRPASVPYQHLTSRAARTGSADAGRARTRGRPGRHSATAYTGPCTITTPNTVISEKRVNCNPLSIETTGVRVVRSLVNGAIDVGDHGTDPEGDDPIRVTVVDSEIDAGAASGDFRPISVSHYSCGAQLLARHVQRRRMSQRLHHRRLVCPRAGSHASGMRVLRNGTVTGSVIWCEPNPNSDDDNDGDLTSTAATQLI